MISGPPNRLEIARKEYLLNPVEADLQAFPIGAAEKVAAGYSPDRIAAEIVSELLAEGIRLTQRRSRSFEPPDEGSPAAHNPGIFAEFWISLASLLSGYTAAYGLSANRQATVDTDEDRITVRHGRKWLDLKRNGAAVTWTRENGTCGTLELTEHGCLRGPDGEQDAGHGR